MKTALFIIVFVAAMLWLGDIHISLSPFRISLPDWYKPLSIVFFTLAMSVYVIGDKEKEYKKGYNQALKDIVNVVAEEIKNDKVSNTEEGSNE